MYQPLSSNISCCFQGVQCSSGTYWFLASYELRSGLKGGDNAATGRQTARHLDVHGGQQNGGCDSMTQTAVKIGENSYGEGSQGVRDWLASREFLATVEIDQIAAGSNQYHDRHLLVFGLDCEGGEENIKRHEKKIPVWVQGVRAGRSGRGVVIDGPVQSGTQGDAVAQEQAVKDSVDQAN